MIGQHQIPQEISTYEFRLVGSMTLKQFLKMAAGVLVGVIFYSSHLPVLIKFVALLASVLAGFAFAFMPINERPLELWVFSFFKRIFSPTIYLWKKSKAKMDIVALSQQAKKAKFFEKVPLVDKQKKLEEFVESLPLKPEGKSAPPPIYQPKAQPTPVLKPAVLPPSQPTKTEPEPSWPTGPSWEQLIQLWKKKTKQKSVTKEAEFVETKLPATPTTPNIVNGLVVDENESEIEGAIVEIQDLLGNPVRAMRTNGLGQFQTATPLPNGEYLIVVEKEPYQFDIIKLKAEGKIILPIKIKAQRQLAS